MLELKNITAIFIDGVGKDTEKICNIITKTNLKIKFDNIFHFSVNPITTLDYVTPFKINPMTYGEFNNFCLKNVYPFLITDYSIWMQTDGFILNPNLWDDNFYNYDYIGSPWPWFKHHVGNGGFSFRSKKLLYLLTKVPYIERNEDAVICDLARDFLLENGCKYAPLEVALKWGLERDMENQSNDLNQYFGFHGGNHLENAMKIFNKNFGDSNEGI
jgi:hypothetical protein